MDLILWPVVIFFAIMISGSIGTLRLILMVRGRRFLSVLIVFFEACIGIASISKIVQDVSGIYSIIAYGAGAAAGLFIGMLISDRVSRNIMSTNIISNKSHNELEVLLRDAGFGVTSFYGNGKDGNLKILNVVCSSSKLLKLRKEVYREDSKAFMVTHYLDSIRGGFLYNIRPDR